MVLKRHKQRTRNVILAPASMHHKILQAAHSSRVAGHTGVDKTLSRVPNLTISSVHPRDLQDTTRTAILAAVLHLVILAILATVSFAAWKLCTPAGWAGRRARRRLPYNLPPAR